MQMLQVQTLQAGILSLLIAVTGWLNDGLKDYKAKKYDDAIKKFTKVIEKKDSENRFRDIALFYRAQSYRHKGEKEKSLSDLLNLLKNYEDSPFAADSRKLYKELGGDLSKILPADSPLKVWQKFVAAAKVEDIKAAIKLSTGDWKKLIMKEAQREPGRFKKEFGEKNIIAGKEKIGTGENAGTAILPLTIDRGVTITLKFILDKKGNAWKISGFKEMQATRRRRGGISNMNNLKQIGLACRMYSNVHEENFPPSFDALKTEGFLENNEVYLWTNSDTGKKHPFIYCPGFNEADSVDTMLAAAPKAVNERREVLWLDGHVKTISEKEFIKNAKAQKWRLPGLIKKEEIPKEKKEKALKLIKQLADKDFNVRNKAKKELIKMGDEAYPFLEENKNHPDPEIKMTVKDILKRN